MLQLRIENYLIVPKLYLGSIKQPNPTLVSAKISQHKVGFSRFWLINTYKLVAY